MQETENKLTLRVQIASIDSLSPKQIDALHALGIYTIADLIKHLPYRYETHRTCTSIEEAKSQFLEDSAPADVVSIEGVVAEIKPSHRYSRTKKVELTLEDDSDSLTLNWFNQPWIAKKFHPDDRIRVVGKLTEHQGMIQMNNPKWEAIDELELPMEAKEGELCSIYQAADGITSTHIDALIKHHLPQALSEIEDHFSDDELKKFEMPQLARAYAMCHSPELIEDVHQGRRRIAFDELFLLQLGVMLKRHQRRDTLSSPPLRWDEEVRSRIAARIHFDLTDDQVNVIEDIAKDVTSTIPMNRLLQGDVGSGKTVVALHAMLMAVTSQHQAALMAPTELLAEQHFKTLAFMLEGSSVRLALLTSSVSGKEREKLKTAIADGDVDIVIGTHALLTSDIEFNNIAIVITDEQHRFGVHQRATLRNKGDASTNVPHTLVMTATPIPRTLSLTQFGDLEVSTIKSLPPGRTPVKTRHVLPEDSAKVYTFAKEQIALGHQCYVVVPLVEDTNTGLKSAVEHAESVKNQFFLNERVEVVHGRMKSEEREQVMQEFRSGAIDVLVATTVIEVGVDVPNATLMIIEHADRFGLAQLHQLRGRVGRGVDAGVCALIASPQTEDAVKRLEAIVQTTDGFLIAEKDLEIRGPGELFGAKQSGIAPFKVADVVRDTNLLQFARTIAKQMIEDDPTLTTHPLLMKRLMKVYGDSLGLGDVA